MTLPVSTPIEPVTTLKVEPGEEQLAVHLREERLARRRLEELLDLAGRPVVGRQRVRVERRVAPEGEDGAVARVDRDDRAGLVAERVAGHLLHVLADRDGEVADVLVVDEQVGHVAQVDLGGAAGELVAVGRLEAGRPEVEVEVAGDVPEQLALRVLPLELERVVRLGGAGQHRAVGADDRAPGTAELLDDLAGVAGVVVELLLADDLDVVELHEQDREAGDERDAEPADLAVHPAAFVLARPDRAARLLTTVGLVRDAHEQGEQHVVGDERRPAVGDERQRHPRQREDPGDPGDDDEGLDADQRGQTGGQQLVERRLGLDGDPQAGPDHQQERDEHRGAADQAELLGDRREDEVVLHLGDAVGGAEAQTAPGDAAPRHRVPALDDLEPARSVGIGPRVQPAVDPFLHVAEAWTTRTSAPAPKSSPPTPR